jgi:hypothetical protein
MEATVSDADPHPYNDLGRRIFAAVLSYHLRLRSLDYTLRAHTPEIVAHFWGELGEQLLRREQERVMDLLFGQPGGKPQLVVDNTSNKDNQ